MSSTPEIPAPEWALSQARGIVGMRAASALDAAHLITRFARALQETRSKALEDAARLCQEHERDEWRWLSHYGPTGPEPDPIRRANATGSAGAAYELEKAIRSLRDSA